MSKLRKVNQENLKDMNSQIILNCIRKYKEISRIDLAAYTRLSPTTISSIVSELISKGMVTELGIGESSGGRRPVMVGINPDGKYVISIMLTPKGATYALINLKCQIVEQNHIDCKANGESIVKDTLINCIDDIFRQFPKCKEKVCGIGISIPGVIDRKNGKVFFSSTLHLRDFDMASIIKDYTGIKCFIFKDTDSLILGEYNFGTCNRYSNFIYIIVENGVGMSYIHSGKLFNPSFVGGLELGHLTIDSNGARCRCGNTGCLGTVVSEEPAIKRLEKLIKKGYESEVQDTKGIHLSDIVAMSNRGDKAALYVLEEQARLLGIGVANVMNMFNPEMIVIGGSLNKCKWNFLEQLINVVKDRALDTYSSTAEIRFAELGEESALLGMANEIYENKIFRALEL